MSFTVTDEDGSHIQQVYSCTECLYCSERSHFKNEGDRLACVLCGAPVEKLETQKTASGMSSFKYRQLLEHIENKASGVGAGTRENIECHFEDGNDFIDAAKRAYDDQIWDDLTTVSGVGESTAEAIALAVADLEGWSGGLAESSFSLNQ